MILRHTLVYTGVKFLPALASLAALMIFTRLMSPKQFGEYSLTVNVSATLVAILANFIVIGLGRFEPTVKSELEKSVLHSTITSTAVVLSCAVTLFMMLLALLDILPSLSINFFFLIVLFQVTLLLMLSQKLINANLQPKRYGLSLALKNILLLVLGGGSLLLGLGTQAVLASLAAATLIASLPALSLWGKISFKLFDLGILRQLWAYGAPLTLLYLFVMIISFSDRIFIDIMLGSSEVGIYSAGYDLTQYTIGFVASIIHLAAFPIILKVYEKEGEKKTKILLTTTLKILLLLIIPVTLGFIATQSEIAELILGDAFSSTATTLMPILALSILLSTIKSYYFDYTFQLTKQTWLQAIPPLIAAIFNCILNYILILKFGLVGAAYATLASFSIYLMVTVFLSGKVFNLPAFPWFFTLKVVVSGLIMAFSVSMLPVTLPVIPLLIFKVLSGCIVFSICLLILLNGEVKTLLGSVKQYQK
ncbi:hypothetical protein CBP31_03405 [Oceanisphaera profunda]|uniref:Uncharacterized protein n=1 Tax=Oceanisphaera profunda TaxID=1416627 RepID=A0A1Y0D381_9GAMM|nr:oligosaccharide flippase family protein [Oceanisphaera profunda]ART81784.1 hypothetical protein CBP31_03405 [Oceanisphaera profunda]